MLKNLFVLSVVGLVGVCARPDIGLKLREGAIPSGSYLPVREGYDHSTSSGSVSPGYHEYNEGSVNIGYNQGPAAVEKHAYFYDAPEADFQSQITIHQEAGSEKHNTVFVKAPAYRAPKIHFPQVKSSQQERTVVYVLVQKPEEAQDIVIPSVHTEKVSKPEVYFINYKNQKEAEHKIHLIQQGDTSHGKSASDVGSDQALISTIKDNEGSGSNLGYNFAQQQLNGGEHHQAGAGNYYAGNKDHGHQQQHYSGSGSDNSVANYGPAGASGPYKKRSL